jgi:hypothetical protein
MNQCIVCERKLIESFLSQTMHKPAGKPEVMMLEKIVNVNGVDIAYQLHGNKRLGGQVA